MQNQTLPSQHHAMMHKGSRPVISREILSISCLIQSRIVADAIDARFDLPAKHGIYPSWGSLFIS